MVRLRQPVRRHADRSRPDRDAAHCVDPAGLRHVETVTIGGEVRRRIRIALPSTWRKHDAAYVFSTVGRGASCTVKAEDRGDLIECQALGSNAGGRSETPFSPESAIRG